MSARRLARKARLLRWYNRNYVGTQFGGSLYSMTDPFYMLMLMENQGRDYPVGDKAASIDFIAPGRGPLFATFAIDQAFIGEVRQHTAAGQKYLPELQVDVRAGDGSPVARVHKTLYVRLPAAPAAGSLRKYKKCVRI